MQTNKDPSIVKLGEKIILAGLCIQIVVFGLFIAVAVKFHERILKNSAESSSKPDLPWGKHLKVLYGVSLLIMIRSLIRVIEYIQGHEGYILSHEAFLYTFDGILMFLALAVFNWIHPSQLIPGRQRTLLYSRDDSRDRNVSMYNR